LAAGADAWRGRLSHESLAVILPTRRDSKPTHSQVGKPQIVAEYPRVTGGQACGALDGSAADVLHSSCKAR
jgi:hypothetical protein